MYNFFFLPFKLRPGILSFLGSELWWCKRHSVRKKGLQMVADHSQRELEHLRLFCVSREDAYSRTAYFIRHTALSCTYAIVAYVRHNSNADSPVFGIPALPHWNESSQLQMKLQYASNQRTHPSLWFSTHGCEKKWSATIMFVLSKARIGLSTWLNEPRHSS